MSTDKSRREVLHQTALKAPHQSGVYLWRNEEGTVLYVGKAKSLKNRLSSYFSGNKDIKTRTLISRAYSIEYIVTPNEYEAFVLENNFIKQYNPHFNIDLKDDKSYPMLRITNERFPRVFKTRQIVKDGSRYFGPYPNVWALDTFIEALHTLYPLRQCHRFKAKDSPCLYYHIGKCSAPCCNKISAESYNSFIGEISAFLDEDSDKTCKNIERTMKEAAAALQFEKAAKLRDALKAVKELNSTNTVNDFDPEGRDYIAFAQEGSLVSFAVLCMRNGHLVSRERYRSHSMNDADEMMTEFFSAYYTDAAKIPALIFVPPETDVTLLKQWMKESWKRPCRLILMGGKSALAAESRHIAAWNMAQQNAKEDLIRAVRERGDMPAMRELQKALDLPRLPVRIEGFDIAHIGGKFPVASLISFYNGNPDKKNYRYFRLKTTDGYIDDFASMKEAVSRRYSRLMNDGEELPDLIMIDGGIGQVNAVNEIIEALGCSIPIVGLAKRDEELYRPGNSTPICLSKHNDGLRLLQRVRDETHRFATSRNQRLRTKENVISRFELLPHIGPKRARIIMDTWGTLTDFTAAMELEPETVASRLSLNANDVKEALAGARVMLDTAEHKRAAGADRFQPIPVGPQNAAPDFGTAVPTRSEKLSSLASIALDDPADDVSYAAERDISKK
ncbi:MAG: excinuclease ABC subunit UvrC [Treponemataceae bacterium]|nr:excinuclease ABC subunit UvrC [Treponemataceae bacterium]